MRKERTTLPVSAIAENRGQLPWLRRNPRQWTKDDVRRTAASIREDPDFLEERPLCVVPHGDGYIVFAGNLRLNGAREAWLDTVPAVVHYPVTDADRETVLRRAMKDNGSFGSWDFDTLANEWDDLPLQDWGVPVWDAPENAIQKKMQENNGGSPEDYGTEFTLPEGEKTGFRQISFQLSDEMADVVLFAVKAAHYTEEFYSLEGDEEDKNGNGVAVYLIAKWWLDMTAKELGEDFEKAKVEAEGLRQYLRDALAKSGHKAKDVDDALGTHGMSGHYFGDSQWMFPTKKAYKIMQEFMPLERDYLECKLIELRYNLLKTLKTQWEEQKK
jgi:hypothetical protein